MKRSMSGLQRGMKMAPEKDAPRCGKTRGVRSARFVVRSLWHVGMAGFLLFSSAVSLWSQAGATGRGAAAMAAPPFAALNASLEDTADAILASAVQANVATGLRPTNSRTASLAVRHDDELRPAVADAALSRIAVLRPMIDPILRAAGIPTELAAVVLVESGGNPMALSPKGARGLWQLMPETAQRYGLIVNSTEDDRLDVEKSTRAAAHYLSDLHSEFGSWPLALAAYNTGEQNLQSAIERSRSTDFTVLSSLGLLPLETRNYVPAVFAAVTQLTNSRIAAQLPIQGKWGSRTVFAVAERSN